MDIKYTYDTASTHAFCTSTVHLNIKIKIKQTHKDRCMREPFTQTKSAERTTGLPQKKINE